MVNVRNNAEITYLHRKLYKRVELDNAGIKEKSKRAGEIESSEYFTF